MLFLSIFATDSTFVELQFKIKDMKQRKMKQLLFLSLISALLLSGCADKDVYQGGGEEDGKNTPLSPTEAFDFNLSQEVKVNVDYGFTNDYYIIFELYTQNPMKEVDGSWVKDESLSYVHAASTDKNGQYSGTIQISSDITELWLYTDYLGAISPVELTVSNGEISYNQAGYIAALQTKTRGVTSNGHNYLDDWKLMPGLDWDIYGFPSLMEEELSLPSATILYSIKETYSNITNKRIKDLHPEWLNNNTTSEIKITKPTELSLVFVASSASWNNAVGYFTYPTGATPTLNSIQKILAFPNASPISKISNGKRVGALLCGHEVKLKYWNEATQQFEDEFPAGVTIGWCLEGASFKDGTVKRESYAGTRYSYSSLNSDNEQRVVALRDGGTDQIVAIGFEDKSDFDYCDATFYLKIANPGSIDTETPELPSVDPPSTVNNTTTGILAFEDLWPSRGDYDMNDVMLEYKSTLYQNALTGKAYRIVDEFTPLHNGGSLTSGFGYQLYKLGQDGVRSIQVDGPAGWKIEADQSSPTIILFDNVRSVIGQKYTVTIELNDVDPKLVASPYNPFIFVENRDKEVHMVNYPPTAKADKELFNTHDDVSNVSAGIYYISRYKGEVELMPFGMNLPIIDFKLLADGEGVKIYETFPNFIGWVQSGGTKNKDWYKRK